MSQARRYSFVRNFRRQVKDCTGLKVSPFQEIGWLLRIYSFLGIIQAQLKPDMMDFHVRWYKFAPLLITILLSVAQIGLLMEGGMSEKSGFVQDYSDLASNMTAFGKLLPFMC